MGKKISWKIDNNPEKSETENFQTTIYKDKNYIKNYSFFGMQKQVKIKANFA